MQQLNSNLIINKRKTGNFTIIDNAILQDKNLSLKARGLLCFMLHLPSDWTFTEKGLSTVTGEGLKSIKSGLKELEEQKYLYRFQNRSKSGSFGSMIYYLFEQPTTMLVDNEEVYSEPARIKVETTDTFNIDKDSTFYEYINGGWMTE